MKWRVSHTLNRLSSKHWIYDNEDEAFDKANSIINKGWGDVTVHKLNGVNQELEIYVSKNETAKYPLWYVKRYFPWFWYE